MDGWLVNALLAAVAASLVAIFAKLGMKEVDPTLATAARSVIMTLLLVMVGSCSGAWSKLSSIGGRAAAMIALSGIAGAASWLFYFRAIQRGDVAQVAAIDKLSMPLAVVLAVAILGERPAPMN